MPNIARTIAGLAVAPIVPGILIAGAPLVIGEREEAQVVMLGGAIFGYATAFLLGAPSHLLLIRGGWTSWWHYALSGAGLGVLLYAGLPLVIDTLMQLQGVGGSGHVMFSASVLPAAMACVTLAAVSFWLIVRPDRAPARRA